MKELRIVFIAVKCQNRKKIWPEQYVRVLWQHPPEKRKQDKASRHVRKRSAASSADHRSMLGGCATFTSFCFLFLLSYFGVDIAACFMQCHVATTFPSPLAEQMRMRLASLSISAYCLFTLRANYPQTPHTLHVPIRLLLTFAPVGFVTSYTETNGSFQWIGKCLQMLKRPI